MALTLTVLLGLYLGLVEVVRENTLRLETECITDIGMNSVLAEYHRELLRQYGLLYIDSSYGTDCPSFYNTEAHLREYIQKNMEFGNDDAGVYLDLLEMEPEVVEIQSVMLATDNGGCNLRKQAVKVQEYRGGVAMLDELNAWITVIEEKDLLDDQMEEELERVEAQLNVLKERKPLQESLWFATPVEKEAEDVFTDRKKGIGVWISDLLTEISSKQVDPEEYVSARKEAGKMNQGNIEYEHDMTMYERIAFQEYLLEHVGNYRKCKEGTLLDYQIEYLLFGEAIDGNNLIKTTAAICGIREAANMIYVFGDAEKRTVAKSVASGISTMLFAPETEPILENAILIIWSCVESVQDVMDLLNGESVPLIKGLTAEMPELQYEDYLRILLYFSDLQDITYRFMDIVEMDIRQTDGNECFRMDGCIEYLEAKVQVQSSYGKTYTLYHAKGY